MSLQRAAVAVSFLLACTRAPAVGSDAETVKAIDAAPVTSARALDASAPVATVTPPRPPLAPCRALAATGKIATSRDGDGGSRGIAMGDALESWIDLDDAARVTVKEPRTGRELLFIGAAHVLPCVQESEAWLARGQFTSARGSGEKPGAEQWIVTPFAVVRYGAAILDVKVNADGTRAVLKLGGAAAIAEGGGSWHALDPAVPLVAKANAPEGPDACAKTSADAKSLEDQLLAPGETRDPSFGDLAKRTTEARILARANCAMKALRAALRPEPR